MIPQIELDRMKLAAEQCKCSDMATANLEGRIAEFELAEIKLNLILSSKKPDVEDIQWANDSINKFLSGSRVLNDIEQEVLKKTLAKKVREVRHYHDPHCSANPFEPMGNEGCSCTMYQRAKKAENKLEQLLAILHFEK
jgi:hypothetical protein